MSLKGLRFCIYYGWLVADATGAPGEGARHIAAIRPALLVAAPHTAAPPLLNLSAPVLDLLHAAGTRILAYVDVSYGRRPLSEAAGLVRAAITLGADGVLLDEVEHRWDVTSGSYYRAIASIIHDAGGIVAMNPGVGEPGEELMEAADLLMLEHRWRDFIRLCTWRHRYAAQRFMGVSSNEPGAYAVFSYTVDAHVAAADAQEAWANGVGWHCATDRFIDLPPWG